VPQVRQATLGSETRSGAFRPVTTDDETNAVLHPKPLPPDPPVATGALQHLADAANQALGRLDGITGLLPNPDQLLYS
jgi:hypothetical protein